VLPTNRSVNLSDQLASGLVWAMDKYQYDWKTDKAWGGTCRLLTVKLVDNTVHTALFNFAR